MDRSGIKFIDLLLYSEEEVDNIDELLIKHSSILQYLHHLPANVQTQVIQYAGFDAEIAKGRCKIKVLKGKNRKWAIPLKLFFELRKEDPDVILVHSMIYSWQIIFLSLILKRSCKILVQNHAEGPGNGLRKLIQIIADRGIAAYFFVSREQSATWIEKGIISGYHKVHEVMEGSTNFEMKRNEIKQQRHRIFLWVGRLNQNKDPLTILKAFRNYTKADPDSTLWMVYSTTDLLDEVKEFISENGLIDTVELMGKIEHALLENYYNRADYFILGSHYEGGGYALCEAMACGCVPIVTRIPSFLKMLDGGNCGHLFSPGNSDELFAVLKGLKHEELPLMRQKVLRQFENDLSFKAIANRIYEVSQTLVS